jgi:hypothetical protein
MFHFPSLFLLCFGLDCTCVSFMLRGQCVCVCVRVWRGWWWGIYCYESHSKMGCERVAYVSCSVEIWNEFAFVTPPWPRAGLGLLCSPFPYVTLLDHCRQCLLLLASGFLVRHIFS